MRNPVSWNQHWLPRAYKAGVVMVDGDHYYAARSKAMGVRAYYSQQLGAWVYIHPMETKQYSLWELGWTTSEQTRDGVTVTAKRIKHRHSQEDLSHEFGRLALLGADNDGKRADGKTIRWIVEEQDKAKEETTESNRMDSAVHLDEVAPPEPHPAEAAETIVAAALTELKTTVWSWFTQHLTEWNFKDEEKAEVTEQFTAATGISAPTSTYLVQVNVQQGMTPEQIREVLHNNKIEVTEISA